MQPIFRDRRSAGEVLAEKLDGIAQPGLLVLALPRGGVPVAFPIAQRFSAPMDVFVVRKLGVPGQEELAFGAIASGGIRVLNEEVIAAAGLSAETIQRVTAAEQIELERREELYRGDRQVADVTGRCVLLVDDGLATGATMRAAVQALRLREPDGLIIAVPVASPEALAEFDGLVDHIVCAHVPEFFDSVGSSYQDFSQTSDREVDVLLAKAARP